MINATLTDLRHDASIMLYDLPEKTLTAVVQLLKELTGKKDGAPIRAPRGEPGIAAGEFVLPDDFDADNELIADLFEGKQ